MIVKTYNEVAAEPVTMPGAKNVTIRWLLGQDSPAPNFYLRLFEVQPGGHSPYHTHASEHEIFILEGRGRINAKGGHLPGRRRQLRPGGAERGAPVRKQRGRGVEVPLPGPPRE